MVETGTILQLTGLVLAANEHRIVGPVLTASSLSNFDGVETQATYLDIYLPSILLNYTEELRLILSFFLFLVTIYYARQLQKSADYTQDTLVEMEKDRKKEGIILAISHVLDPLVEEVRNKQADWDRSEGPPEINEWKMPDETFVTQLGEANTDTHSQFQMIIEDIKQYKEERVRLQAEISRFLMCRIVWPDPPDNKSRKREQELAIDDGVHRLANYIINPTSHNAIWSSGTKLEFNELDMDDENLSDTVRRLSETSDDIEKLESDVEDLQTDTDRLLERLLNSRKELKEEYGISEVEILRSKENVDMSKPELTKESKYRGP